MADHTLVPEVAVFVMFLLVVNPSSMVTAQYSEFLLTLGPIVDELKQLVSLFSTYSGVLDGGDIRSASAVQDCLELFDLSMDELNWTMSTTQSLSLTSASRGGQQRHDLQSWLSAALSNQDTCAEGLDGTDLILKSLVVNGIGTVTNLVAQVLPMIPNFGGGIWGGGGGGGGRKLLGGKVVDGFPNWMGPAERRLMQMATSEIQPDAVVAADGSGDFKTVTSAVDAAPKESMNRIVIYIKRGVYVETVNVKATRWNIMLIGDGMGATIISGERNVVDGWTTYRSATFAVSGKGFIARDITFENTAGPEKHQAVALRSDSDLSVFFRCEFIGYQDTLYAHTLRQFYRECRISGTVDFIFGNAAAVFQDCEIVAREPLPLQKNTITAQGRRDPNQNTGFSIQFCNITADVDLAAQNQTRKTSTYLGRPWNEYSRTVVMQSYLGPLIDPQGWLEWSGDFALATLYYGEFMNDGPGSDLENRVSWPGFHAIIDSTEAAPFTVQQFIDGDSWLPSTGVKYTSGLGM